jgi:hypothetical protein
MRLSSGHEIGSKTVRRCIAPQLVLTCYKLLEIERGRQDGGKEHTAPATNPAR